MASRWDDRVDVASCQCTTGDAVIFSLSAVLWLLFFGLSFYKAIVIRLDIQQREDTSTLLHLSTSKVLIQFMSNTSAGIVYDALVGLLSVASTGLFVWDTYNPEDTLSYDDGNATSTRRFLLVQDDEESSVETGWVLQVS